MQIIKSDIVIIGGGLTGLMLAYLLKDTKANIVIVEARERLGGRILTTSHPNIAPVEMGATWLGKKHHHLVKLLNEIELDIFEQSLGDKAVYEPISTSPPQLVRLPPNEDPSFRIKNGSNQLIKTLTHHLNNVQIYTSEIATSITKTDNITVISENYHFQTKKVVSTLPPFLLQQSITIKPTLPTDFIKIAQQTHTWMGESIKVGLTYKTPFWQAKNTSGTIFSNVGPISEMYDHSNYENSFFALKGFLNGAYFSITKEERLHLILNQLKKYYGTIIDSYLTYEEVVWRNEPFTFKAYSSHVLPHQNNGHPIFRTPYLDNSLYIAGTETAPNFPGYMEGAIQSAQYVYHQIKNDFLN